MIKKFPAITASLLAATVGLAGCATSGGTATSRNDDARDQFMATLNSLCGQRFEGVMTYPADPKHDFAGKRLVAHFAACKKSEVRAPFQVGEDRSRTWVFTSSPAGLQLQHDHRHQDGTPDAVTMYGGMANLTGSALSQSFSADAYTARLIPAAVTNVWTVSLSADRTTLTYHLEREAKPRVTAVFRRVSP